MRDPGALYSVEVTKRKCTDNTLSHKHVIYSYSYKNKLADRNYTLVKQTKSG